MTQSKEISRGQGIDFRQSLLDLLWKITLVIAVLALGAALLSAEASWQWTLVPILMVGGCVVSWQLLQRDRLTAAAWVYVVVTEITILLPTVLVSDASKNGSVGQVLVAALPLASLIIVSISGILLPSWSMLVLLGTQVVTTLVMPFFLGRDVESMHLWASLVSVAGGTVVWTASGALLRNITSALSSHRDHEQRAVELAQSRDELRRTLSSRNTLAEQLRQVNANLTRQTTHLEASSEVSQVVSSTLNLEQMLTDVASVLDRRFSAFVLVFLVEEQAGRLVLSSASRSIDELAGDLGDLRIDRQSSLGASVLQKTPRFVGDVKAEAVYLDHLLPDTQSEVVVPLMSRDVVLGILNMQSQHANAFGHQDVAVLTTIAEQVGNGIANLRSFSETRQALDEVSRLQRRYVQEAWDRFAPQLEAAGYRFADGDTLPLGHRPLPQVSRVLADGQMMVEQGQRVVAPIEFRGEVIGALGLEDPDGTRQWTEQDINLVESVARQMSVIIDNARLVEETQQSLSEITELNRRYVREAWDDFLPTREANEFVFAQPGVPRDAPLPAEIEAVLRESQLQSTVRSDDGRPESTLAAPINLRDQVVGALGLQEVGEARQWTEDDVELVDAVATQMSWAIENARLFEETERRAFELEETAEQLRETDLFRSQFLANMSHELRTPLNSIIGFSRVILKGIDGPLTDMQTTDLEAIYSNGQHLLTMINEILDMSKMEAGKMELVIENVDLNVLVRGVVSTSTALVKDKPIKLVTEIEEGLPIIRADGTRIRQVITNLMSNAAKFTEEGSITFRVWTQQEMVYVSVQDTGEGIPDEKVPLVFEAFRQVDGSSTRRAEGTGLGMPISRQFVEMHGGEIWLET